MRIASTAVLTALGLVVLAHGGVLACSGSDSDGGADAAVAGAGGATAGAAGAATAGAPAGGSPSMGGGGASAAGSAGVAGSAAGSGGAAAGSGGSAGSAGGSGGSAGISGGAGAAGSAGMAGSGGAAPFALTSTSFMAHADCTSAKINACDRIDLMYELTTIGGQNHSPELEWTAGPAATLSYAISLFDDSNMYPHWVIWNIPATTHLLPASLPGGDAPDGLTGVKQVSFNGNKTAYAGPGATSHVYEFKLYALKVAAITIDVSGNAPQQDARNKLEASTDVIATSILRVASSM